MSSSTEIFHFRQFELRQGRAAQKCGTDALLLGAWQPARLTPPRRVLDVGTGTGVLALMLAQRYPKAEIEAWELEAEAAAIEQAVSAALDGGHFTADLAAQGQALNTQQAGLAVLAQLN